MVRIKKEKDIKILNTGSHLPKPTIEQELRFLADCERFVGEKVRMQSKKDGVVIYGAQAVNAIVGPWHSRPTSDFDVMSKTPKHHAIQLEQSIDNHTRSDISYVEEVPFVYETGKSGKMYRVRLRNFNTVADYNKIPLGMKSVKIDGVRYEVLERAEKKYNKMLAEDDFRRIVNANQDLDRIWLFKYNRRMW